MPLIAPLALGAALRLALLPALAHPDLLSMQDRARLVLEGTHRPSDFTLQALPVALHAAWASASGAALPDMGGVPWPDPTEAQVFDAARRVWAATAAPTLALWKLPYLLADLALGLVLARLASRRRRAAVLALWAVHPFALYATGAFAKHEAWMLLPLAVGLLAIRAGRLERGFLWVGLAIAMRLYPLLLLPAMVLAADPRPRRRAELAVLACAPTAAVAATAGLVGRGVAPPLAWGGVVLGLGAAVLGHRVAARRGRTAWVAVPAGLAAAWLAPGAFVALAAEDSPLWSLLHHVSFLFGGLGPARPDGVWWFGLASFGVLFAAGARARARTAVGSTRVDGGSNEGWSSAGGRRAPTPPFASAGRPARTATAGAVEASSDARSCGRDVGARRGTEPRLAGARGLSVEPVPRTLETELAREDARALGRGRGDDPGHGDDRVHRDDRGHGEHRGHGRDRGRGDARPVADPGGPDAAGEDVLDAALAAGLVFFSLAFFHPQYTALLMLLVLARWDRLAGAAGLHALQVVGVLLLLFGFRDGHTTLALALPLVPEAGAEWLGGGAGPPGVLGVLPWPAVGRALLIVAAAGMALRLGRRPPAPEPPPPARAVGSLALGLALAAWPLTAVGAALLAGPSTARELALEWARRLAPTTAAGLVTWLCLATAGALGLCGLRRARRGGSVAGQ